MRESPEHDLLDPDLEIGLFDSVLRVERRVSHDLVEREEETASVEGDSRFETTR